ncbi:MAG TPA: sugar ABC transporter substrate-binding protein [Anaerolineales bacterium]|nr:sugar ABC transporter substrate-binding protein [Anaerolineales bacterium]HEX3051232.1 sugar ABC transporter substrate-binding protein [Aggregatilineaceae bacterium]
MKFARVAIFIFLTLAIAVPAVGPVHARQDVTIRYWLWDNNQLPAYTECANQFMASNPGITVEIEQLGWGDYWEGIQSGFITGDAPDVFTNHLAKYPEFVALEQLVDIQPLVERDGVPTDIYYPGLADLWVKDDARYGLPKDWDTVAVVYNADMLEAAGIDPAVMDEWTWNPEDGGTFEQVVAQLTLDANGNNGLSPDFDKDNVVQYGFADDWPTAAGYGQTSFSVFTASTGWTYNNGLWGDEYYYDDPRFTQSIQSLADLWLKKGYAPQYADLSGLGYFAMFQAGKVALTTDGSWMIGSYLGSEFPVGFGRLPIGPEGRKSMFNGLADSIWVGSEHKEESWQWVKFLASAECQNIVGQSGAVFPAIPEAAELSLNVRAEAGIDVSAFTLQAAEEGGTFLFPITDYGGEITVIMQEAMDRIALGEVDAETALKEANEEVNALFE